MKAYNEKSRKCIICNSFISKQKKYINKDFDHLNDNIFKDLSILICSKCGFSYTHPYIDNKQLNNFYKYEYAAKGGPHYEFKDFKHYNWPNVLSSRFISQLILSAQYLDLSKISNFLDVGANTGESFKSLKKMGFNPRCHAIEINEDYITDIKKAEYQIILAKDEYLTLDKKYHNSFELILMSHVLEHFQAYQLESILTNLLNYLAHDGVLIVEVPNDNFKIFNSEYVNQSPHLSFFSLDSIKILFEKIGFEILYLNTVGKEKINKNMDHHLKPKQQNFDRIKLFVKNQKFLNYIKLIIFDYFIKWFRLKYRYLSKNQGIDLVSSPNFHYGSGRSAIRICVKKAY